jgi:hypothetical protein
MTGNNQIIATLPNEKNVGLQHLIQITKEEIDKRNSISLALRKRIAAIRAEFRSLAHLFDLPERFLPGFEVGTWRHDGLTSKARGYHVASLSATLVAIVFGTYFSITTLEAQSYLVLVGTCITVTIALGVIFSGAFRFLLNAHRDNPQAPRNIWWVILIGFVLFCIALGVWSWLRFQGKAIGDPLLGGLALTIEFGALIVAGGFDTAYHVYRWSDELHKKDVALQKRLDANENKIAELFVQVEELKHRLTLSQSLVTTTGPVNY